jgi:hypothetical protein
MCEVAEEEMPVQQDDCVPVRKIQHIPLPLKYGRKKRGVEVISIKEPGDSTAPNLEALRVVG